jgi:hypothetical protein
MEAQYFTVITILSVVCLLLLIGNVMQWVSNSDLHSEVRYVEDKFKAKEKELYDKIQEVEAEKSYVRKTKEELFKIEPGDRGVLIDYNIVTTYADNSKPKRSYHVTFEVEVIEVSDKKLKVRAIDYVSNDAYANDPANKTNILNVINIKGSWINKDDIELILDDTKRRDQKIDDVLN